MRRLLIGVAVVVATTGAFAGAGASPAAAVPPTPIDQIRRETQVVAGKAKLFARDTIGTAAQAAADARNGVTFKVNDIKALILQLVPPQTRL